MNRIPLPKPFVPGDTPASNWERWRERYELYAVASGVLKLSITEQRAVLLTTIGDEGYERYKDFEITEVGDLLTPTVILQAFDDYYRPLRNETYSSFQFKAVRQTEGQTIDELLVELRSKARDCGFGSTTDRMVRDQLVAAIEDRVLRERLLREPSLTLSVAIDMCRAAETAKRQSTQMAIGDETRAASVNKLSSGNRRNFNANRFDFKGATPNEASQRANFGSRDGHDGRRESVSGSNGRRNQAQRSSEVCGMCGATHARRNCPAFGKKCYNCNRMNHYSRMCRLPQRRKLSMLENDESTYEETNDEDGEFDVGTLRIGQLSDRTESPRRKRWTEQVLIQNKTIVFRLDTGADADILPMSCIKQHGLSVRVTKTSVALWTYMNNQVPLRGECTVECVVRNKVYRLTFLVVDASTQPVLGQDTCEKIGLLKRLHELKRVEPYTKDSLIDEFPDVFKGLGKLPGKYSIKLKPNAVPFVASPKNIPKALEEKVKTELQWLLDNDVICKVTEPTEWVNTISIVIKPDGSIRICLDPRKLNEAILRERHQTPLLETQLAKLTDAKVFSLLDGWKAFLHLELEEASSKLCTFITPYGLFRFKRMPYGLCCAPEIFQRAIEETFKTVRNLEPCHDDLLVWGTDVQDHDGKLRDTLLAAREANLKLNKKKLQIGLDEVKYLGHVVGATGIKPDPAKTAAISELPAPVSKKELQRFIGMATYLAKFIPHFSDELRPLRLLLAKDAAWVWTVIQEQCFVKIKQLLITAPVLAYYDQDAPLVLQVDASSYGLGAVALQHDRPIAYASATLTPAQMGYAQIEKELLAAVYGCERFHYYAFGRQVIVQTDHKPLIGLANKPLEKITPRLQRLLLRLQRYDVTFSYRPGKEIEPADALSRSPRKADTMLTDDTLQRQASLCLLVQASDAKLEQVRTAQKADVQLQTILGYVRNGWPTSRRNVVEDLRSYFDCQDELHEQDDLLCRGERLVIPQTLRPEMLRIIHETHRGIIACKARARESLYWPGMTSDINKMIAGCQVCQQNSRNNVTESLLSRQDAEYPWQKIGVDFCKVKNKDYLVVIDYYSKFLEVQEVSLKTASATIEVLKSLCARYGAPQVLASDQGPPFDSAECRAFLRDWGIIWQPSSPRYPKSNGQVERAIQTFKHQLTKTALEGHDIHLLLMVSRNTKLSCGVTPAQLMFARQLRTRLPVHTAKLKEGVVRPPVQTGSFQSSRVATRATSLPPLHHGQEVWVKTDPLSKSWEQATIVKVGPAPRSFTVRTAKGSVLCRNRIHLKPRVCATRSPVAQMNTPCGNTPLWGKEGGDDGCKQRPRRAKVAPARMRDYMM